MPVWEDTTGVTAVCDSARNSSFERDRACLVVISGLHIGQMFVLDPQHRQVLGRSRSAEIRMVDEGVSRRHIAVGPGPDGRLWLEDLNSRNGTYCNGRRARRHLLRDGDKIQLGRATMLRFTYLDEHDEAYQRQMFDSALRDGLTRAFNKRYFTERLRAEVHFARRHAEPLSLLLLDLDHFKEVNDRHGHVAGDQALVEFADSVLARVRNEDVFARFGGEEFAIISRAIGQDDAARFGERLRQIIAGLDIRYQGQPIPLTVSIGLASLPEIHVEEPLDLVKAADRALYRAKVSGRNRVVVYDAGLDEDVAGAPRIRTDDEVTRASE